MASLKDNIKKIARTDELEKKIRKIDLPQDRGVWEGSRGVAINTAVPEAICPLYYSTSDNSYDIADLLAGTVGPQLGDKCARLNTITGLVDFDTSIAVDYIGADVNLIIQMDGEFD